MKYGVTVPPFGDFFDPRTLAALAAEASANGDCVCSGSVENLLVRIGLVEDLMRTRPTPGGLR